MPHSSAPPGFTRSFLRLFIPAATQSLFFNLIGIFDTLMVGQLGDASVAAVGLSNQFYFLLSLAVFGTTSGASVFAAQYFGARDLPNLRRVAGLCLAVTMSAAAAFALVALAFPAWVLGLYTHDPAVVALGITYLRIVGWSYLFNAVTTTFAAVIRSTGNTRLPMLVSVSMLCLNTAMNFCLIFGKLGLPALGVQGAAIGTTIARVLECLVLLGLLYALRSEVAASPRRLFDFNAPFVARHLRLILVVFLNEFFWALGVNVYNALVARLGTSAYAAYSITTAVQSMGMFFAFGCATTCSILVGHRIGAGKPDEAYRVAKPILLTSVLGSLVIGIGLAAARLPLMELYRISPEARQDASAMLLIAGLMLWLRGMDPMFIIGVMRAGGDTRYSAILDVGAIWLGGIPALAVTAFVLHLPVQWVFLAIFTENLIKNAFGLRRFLSRRWIRNLTAPGLPAEALPEEPAPA